MSSSPSTVRFGPLRLTPSAAGAACCTISMLGYSTANSCMRLLSEMKCVSTWAVCNKELVTVLAVGPWILWQAWRRKASFPTGRPLVILIAAGLATELIGNMGIQWGYEIVGLAVMIPTNTAFLLVATAILGALLLGERVSARNAVAIAVLIAAVALLGLGAARSAPHNDALPPANAMIVAAAIGAAFAAGVVFSLLAIAIRHCVQRSTSHAAVVVIITGSGVVTLGPLSLIRNGAEQLLATPWQQYAIILAAGLCNLFAFFALVRGLQFTTALHANTINAGQVAIAAMVGVLFFNEACNAWLVLGVCLMIAGILSFGSPVDHEAIDAHV